MSTAHSTAIGGMPPGGLLLQWCPGYAGLHFGKRAVLQGARSRSLATVRTWEYRRPVSAERYRATVAGLLPTWHLGVYIHSNPPEVCPNAVARFNFSLWPCGTTI
jgi:hypothetical protein